MMLAWIATWLSATLSLPQIYEYPQVKFVSQEEIYAASLSRKSDDLAVQATPVAPARSRIEALYDDKSRTIYLDRHWTGLTPSEISVLVHEMVHHVQNLEGLRYECAEAREELAYVAQNLYLTTYGLSLAKAFRLDPVTLLVRTKCMH